MRSKILPLALAGSLAACGTIADLPPERMGAASLSLASGVPAGTVQVLSHGGSATISVAMTGIAPGEHGLHLHAVGSCTGSDFASAGPHLNPLGRKHGSMAAGGKHAGDLPNIAIAPGGSGSLSAELAGTPAQIRDWLFDSDGTAIVVHAAPDDYATDPSGNSGARVACGVIRPA